MAEIAFDRFKLLKVCGSGGTGEVYQAHDEKLKRVVALKLVKLNDRNREDLLARLRKEAENLASVQHPNVVTLHDVVETENEIGLVMELVDGYPLLRLFRKKAIKEIQFVPYFRQIVEALEAVHESGLIHRDVNPKNVLIDKRGNIKLIDFGLASDRKEEQPRAGGTLGYMAPETLRRGGRITELVDIYSTGFLAYQALLGVAPFKKLYGATKPREWMRWVLSREPFRPLGELTKNVSPKYANLIAKMLSKVPEDRSRSMTEVRKDFETAFGPRL